MSILLEVCVDTPAGLAAAVAGGADRIELCAALETGGLTPSAGFMAIASAAPIPVRALIRPRPGDFAYDAAERDAMLRDIDAAREAGLAGVVIGAIRGDALDLDLLERLADQATGLEVALHRAVDLLDDRLAAVDAAVALGMRTILTSGGGATAEEGLAAIAAMQARAAGRVEIMPGSGVGPANAAAIVRASGVSAVHASCGRAQDAAEPRLRALGFARADRRETDRDAVAALRRALDDLSPVAGI